ncbi:MAG: hypothetical protein WCJ09_00735 [Planctomycetota bacterium]
MTSESAKQQRKDLLQKIKNHPRGLEDILADENIRQALVKDAESDDAVIPKEILGDYLRMAEVVREAKKSPGRFRAAGGPPVVIVPGFLGSALTDTFGDNGLIWIDPMLVTDGSQLSALKLATWGTSPERDSTGGVRVDPSGVVPIAYDLLRWRLTLSGYDVSFFPFDWRKNLEESAQRFVIQIRSVSASSGGQKVRVIAHSQGSLVARRALQILGKSEADQLVDMLLLLGPASAGTYTAAMAISGGHDKIQLFQRWAIDAPPDVAQIFQSMSGLYQLLPWDLNDTANGLKDNELRNPTFWQSGVDRARLTVLYGWASNIDTSFFNARIRIILGEDNQTASAVEFKGGKLTEKAWDTGDGVVLDRRAKLTGVKTYKAKGAKHAWMAAAFNVTSAVLKIFNGIEPGIGRGVDSSKDLVVDIPQEHFKSAKHARRIAVAPKAVGVVALPGTSEPDVAEHSVLRRIPDAPYVRRLRVFSLDPLLMSDPETASYGTMEVEIPWEGPGQSAILPGELRPGPVGEYVEVVDVDPQSGRFYYPIDLNHPHVLAESGLAPSETNPQFHQQMVYAVSMATIRTFERALGRVAHWSPRWVRDEQGLRKRYVQRLRIYRMRCVSAMHTMTQTERPCCLDISPQVLH